MSGLDHNFFIRPGVNIEMDNDELRVIVHLSKDQLRQRWHTPQGENILTRWRANGFRREILDTLVGKYYNHTDIRGIDLSNELFTNVDLSYVDLFGAKLAGAVFEKCNLLESWLSHADISGTRFVFTEMEKVFLDDVEFDHKTKFFGVDLNAINFKLAALLLELAIGQQKIDHLERRNPYFASFLRLTCNYGRSFSRWLLCCILFVVLFTLIYYLVPNTVGCSGWFECSYFSVVIFATLGDGRIQSLSHIGKFLIIVEVSLGYIMLGLLVAIFSRRMIVI